MDIPVDILDSVNQDVLSKPFASVSDRYFEHKYCMSIGPDLKDVHQRISFHSNRICMVSLAENHPIIKGGRSIARINWQISEKVDRLKNTMSGKGKRGAQKLEPNSVICFLECEDKTTYPIYSCIKGKLLEVNENILEEPNLTSEKPKSEGFIAFILPVFSSYEATKQSMLSQDVYLT